MDKELILKIEFSRELTEKEQEDFWDSLVIEIEKFNLRAGGGHDSEKLDWVIDYSDSTIEKGEIIDRIVDFLFERDEMILNYKIE